MEQCTADRAGFCSVIKQIDKISSDTYLIILLLKLYSDMFRLLAAIFGLNLKVYIYIYSRTSIIRASIDREFD
jgi:hypothetical protein